MSSEPILQDCFTLLPRAGSKKLVVFFSATNNPPGKFSFWKAAQEIGESTLFINNGRNEWYQNGVPGLGSTAEETAESIKRLAASIGAESIYTIGVSMGAHGAILYGALADARVLAFGPETLLVLPFSRCERFLAPGTPLPYQDLTAIIERSTKPIYVIVGENDPVDIYCANHVARLPNVTVKSMRRIGHGPSVHLARRGRLIPLINTFIRDEPLPRMPEDGAMCEEPGFAEPYFRMHCALREKNWSLAATLGETAVRLYSTSEQAHCLLGRALMKLDRRAEASSHFAMAFALDPSNADRQYEFADCVRQLGVTEQALYLTRRLVAAYPNYAKGHFELGLIYVDIGYKTQAATCFRIAADLAPNDVRITTRAKRLGWRAGG